MLRNSRLYSPATVHALATSAVAQIIAPVSQGAATVNSSAFDLTGYEGVVKVQQDLGVLTGTIGTNKLQDSADGSTGWADISPVSGTFGTTASASTQVLVDVRACKRYLRYTCIVSTAAILIGVSLTGFKKVGG